MIKSSNPIRRNKAVKISRWIQNTSYFTDIILTSNAFFN